MLICPVCAAPLTREEHAFRCPNGHSFDRARQGYVVDFVDAYWRGWHFWAFNVADAAISIGVAVLILDLLRPPRPAAAV